MFKDLVKESIHEMHNDVKIIRLTFLTSFFHSLIIILLIILNLNSLIAKQYDNGLYVGKVAQFFVEEISKNHFVNIVLIITICLFLLYSVIYPLGQSALIHYLDRKKGIRDSLRKGLKDFFPMFEFSTISMVSSPVIFFLVLLRAFFSGAIFNGYILTLMILWIIIISIFNALKAYTRYFISLEGMPLYESMRRSFQISIPDFKTSMKYMRIQTILLINFSFNLILVLGIPLLLIYLAIKFNITHIAAVKYIIYIVFFLLMVIGAYMSSFIRAFFAYYRYKLYQYMKNK